MLLVNNRKRKNYEPWLPEDTLFRIFSILSNSWPYSSKQALQMRNKEKEETLQRTERDLFIQRMVFDNTQGMLQLLLELLSEGTISQEVFDKKKVNVSKKAALSVYQALLQSGRMMSSEYTRRLEELEHLK